MSADPRAVLTRPAPAPDITLRYGDHPDQIADLRVPAVEPEGSARPLVIVVHGGFWRSEYDRSHTGPLAADLAARGWPVAQLEYRRTGQSGGGWTGTFDDVAAGVTALPALVAEVLGRSDASDDPPILLGHSAGGQLALWCAAELPARVRAVVALAPVADLAEAYRLNLDDGAVAALLGGGPEAVPERYAKTNPAQRVPMPVRSVIIHGGQDLQVPVEMSRRYAAAATAAGSDVSYVELPEIEHFGLIDPESPAWAKVTAALHSLCA
ncbi:MAG TPA: alpha/beta fold hydrolase [Micromonosporaceae bacterium]|nr:alpha/beta fold hydrolase [Micromonosporaceae bacterium]